jgi:hypothetical protein
MNEAPLSNRKKRELAYFTCSKCGLKVGKRNRDKRSDPRGWNHRECNQEDPLRDGHRTARREAIRKGWTL